MRPNRQAGPVDVDSAAFRKWFRFSRVATETLEPLVVYHGGVDLLAKEPPVFRRSHGGKWGPGIYFTPWRATAEDYAKYSEGETVGAYYLRIENPLVIYASGGDADAVLGLTAAESTALRAEFGRRYIEEVGRARGFDGIFVAESGVREGGYVSPDKNVREIVIWEPNQAKSATHNVGTFDFESPDVTRNPGRRRSRRRSSRRK